MGNRYNDELKARTQHIKREIWQGYLAGLTDERMASIHGYSPDTIKAYIREGVQRWGDEVQVWTCKFCPGRCRSPCYYKPSTAPVTTQTATYTVGDVKMWNGIIIEAGPIEFHLHADGKQCRYGMADVLGRQICVEDMALYGTPCWKYHLDAEFYARDRQPDAPRAP